jgi:4-hydroxy-3-polyprenylbenzoate decarboxylase
VKHNRIVVGITGASGAPYAQRTIECLAAADVEVHLTVSTLGRRLLHDELGMKRVDVDALSNGRGDRVILHNDNDVGSSIASGSFLHDGMIIVPASSNTMGAVACGAGDNLVKRAATVTLKERRTLVIAHREAPLSHIDIRNMLRLSEAGAIIVPLAPGFYLLPKSVNDLVDFMVGKLLDLVNVPHNLNTRWDQHLAKQMDDPDAPSS